MVSDSGSPVYWADRIHVHHRILTMARETALESDASQSRKRLLDLQIAEGESLRWGFV